MTSSQHDKKTEKAGARAATGGRPGDPEWKAGLKRLYDSVLDEPLPDAFKDLLSRLDKDDGKTDERKKDASK